MQVPGHKFSDVGGFRVGAGKSSFSQHRPFFNVTEPAQVLQHASEFPRIGRETVALSDTAGRVLATDILSDVDLPDFARSTMDGYALQAASTFGASEGNPAYLTVKGIVLMGEIPEFSIGPGEAAKIPTGGMLPAGSDSVMMIEHADVLDETTIEVYRSVAPGQHVLEIGEDFEKGAVILSPGQRFRPQETGLAAAFGRERVQVYKRPVIGIISTGDEVVPVDAIPKSGEIRDINTHTLSELASAAGAIPISFGIIQDDYETLFNTCSQALEQSDMVLISGGSSVGTRDFTIEVLSALPDSEILVHGISISPGKPTILAKIQDKAFWGLPGHVVSAMIVFSMIVRPFVEHISGLRQKRRFRIPARLIRNLSSAQGRVDYIRVRLIENQGTLWAEPVLGKSGLINTMIHADGLIEIGMNTEGLNKGEAVSVIPL